MELIKNNNYLNIPSTICTIGAFDGFHLGHLMLIDEVFKTAHENHLNTAIITFYPHPDYVLKKRFEEGYLMPLDEKIEFCKNRGFDYFIVIDFTDEIKNMSYQDFYEKYLKNFEMIIVGADFHFGMNNLGSVNKLVSLGANIKSVEVLKYHNEKLSMETVRELLMNGQVSDIKYFLGKNFMITGKVTAGNQVGRNIGFPTANLEIINSYYNNIKNGVYFTYVYYNKKKYLGATNIGNNPSINFIKNKRLEVNILDLNENLYNQIITIEFVERIRDEIKFNTKEELINQIEKDIKYIRGIEK